MKTILSLAAVLLLLAAGCKRPDPIELRTDTPVPTVEFTNVTIDTATTISSIDTTALLPKDEANYPGRFLLNKVTYDNGITPVRSESFASAELTIDRSFSPFTSGDRDHGFYGLSLGRVYLHGQADSLLIPQVPHFFVFKSSMGEHSLAFGVEYQRKLTTTPSPGAVYRWRALPDSIAAFDVAVLMPDNITVSSPAGGSEIPREKDLLMRWSGRGDLSIVVSSIDSRGSLRPVMKLHPRTNTGSAILAAKIMRLLPRDQKYLFTFVLANRNESVSIGRYAGHVLGQAACVYNSYVRLR